MSKKYDLLVYIGRFQPFHFGHQMVIQEALSLAERVLVLVGSVNQPRTPKNPWTYDERVNMISGAFSSSDNSRISFSPVRDRPYSDEQWVEGIQRAVHQNRGDAKKISIIGYTKDESSYYLKKFPQWAPHIEAAVSETINATDLRIAYFKNKFMAGAPLYLPANVLKFLSDFKSTQAYELLVKEQKFLDDHAAMWAFAKYKPTFNTADAIVIQSGHILLGQRKNAPGEGLWAMPGGYIQDSDQTFEDAAIRELIEETQIDVMESVLRSRIKDRRIFMKPDRSLRGRIITEAQLIHLDQHGKGLPKIKGSDDIAKAKWFTIAQFRAMEPVMFEDHYHIVETMIAGLS